MCPLALDRPLSEVFSPASCARGPRLGSCLGGTAALRLTSMGVEPLLVLEGLPASFLM